MAIIITRDGTDAKKVTKSDFKYEENLQKFIHDNPESIPLYDIDEDIRLLILAREVPTSSGPVDAIGIDEKGEVYIIETKLYKNPDKRLVVAQVLDYGAAVSENPERQEYFLQLIEEKVISHFKISLEEKISQFYELCPEDTEALINRIRQNLFAGKICFVVLMDEIDQRLKDLISFLNRNSGFNIYGVELEFYKHESLEITIPKIFGADIKKDISTPSGNYERKRWDEESFFNELANNLNDTQREKIKGFYNFFIEKADIISWGTGTKRGSFNPIFEKICQRSLLTVFTDGTLQLNYAWLHGSEKSINYKMKYRALLNNIFELPDDDGSYKYPTFPVDEWINLLQKIEGIISTLLTEGEG